MYYIELLYFVISNQVILLLNLELKWCYILAYMPLIQNELELQDFQHTGSENFRIVCFNIN